MWTRCGLDVKKIAAADGAEVAGETKEVNGNRDNLVFTRGHVTAFINPVPRYFSLSSSSHYVHKVSAISLL